MKNRKPIHIGIIILAAVFLGFFDLPSEIQSQTIPFTPQAILDSKVNLGLDLQGGSQLDYKVDLRNVPNEQRKNIVDGILNVINKRVNNLGVSEPNIYTSDVGDEKHIIVELAGIKDLNEAKAIVGKTIQLEFKELKEETEDPNVEAEVKEKAQILLDKITAGGDFKVLGKEEEQANPGRVIYAENEEFVYKDQVSENITEQLFALETGEVLKELIESAGNYTVDEEGNIVPGPKVFQILQVLEKREFERITDYPREIKVSHILIAHKDAQRADESITRTEEEAKARAEEALKKVKKGGEFSEIVKEYSDDPSSKENAGTLPEPASKDKGNYVKEFEDAAVAFTEAGQTSELVKSPFGYHILKADEISEAKTETTTEPQVKYINLLYSAAPDPWAATGLDGKHFVRADVEFSQTLAPYITILFDEEGGKMFEELTRNNVGKPMAIFVGGEIISAPNVNEVISGGRAQITGQFTLEEANELARDLNTGAIPAPITLAGQYTIGATLGHDALSKSLYAGLIGFLLVAIFMILYYRLPGILAFIALSIYAAILLFLIKVSLPIVWSLGFSFVLFIYLILRILKNRESGVEKAISAVLACFILFFMTFVLATPVVLTLAGIAGVILSIGMAVDANILIFERVKEELADGRSLNASIEVGFDRAWSSIRDSNFASLITCGILFYFGSSIIQGFAFNLAAGILVSMFSAITITKTFLEGSARTGLGKNLWLFGSQKKKRTKLIPFINKRKILYTFSSALIIITLIGVPIFGLKLGLDFTGGTLMEMKFSQDVTPDQIIAALEKTQPVVNEKLALSHTEKLAGQEGNTTETPETTKPEATIETEPETVVTAEEGTTENAEQESESEETTDNSESESENPEEPANTLENEEKPAVKPEYVFSAEKEEIDLSKSKIVPSENGFIIKTPHISAEAHDILVEELAKELGEFEETRFSTVGPTVGQSLQTKAIFAVILAAIMIVLYIALAFRRIPRYIGKWRFGIAAIVALVHDLIIMVGVYVYLGLFMNVEVDALFITAMLTVLGFSVHDTIVVFDRIREKLKYQKRDETFADVANQALNETMARSINTSISTLFVLATLFLFGAVSIKFFVLSLIVGILAGTYSSIFVATPLLVDWQNYIRKKKNQN